MQSLQTLGGEGLAGVASIWVAQKRELVVAFGGTSMSPTIAPGQKVLLRCGVIPEVGDVAAYLLGDQVAVHRVVAREAGASWLMTWGDANPLPDDPVDDPARIIGTVSRVEQGGAMVAIPSPPRSLRRSLILRFTCPPKALVGTVRNRVSFLYRVRSNLALGPHALAVKIMRKLFC